VSQKIATSTYEYEALRKRVISGQSINSSGLVIVITRGLAAWMHVLAEVVTGGATNLPSQKHHPEQVWEPVLHDEIVHLLANMVSSSWEVAYGN